VSLVRPWLFTVRLERATDRAATDPAAALRELHDAADLNGLTSIPYERAGVLRATLGDERGAAQEFRRALAIEQRFVAYFELASIASGDNRRADAERLIARSLELSPKDPFALEARDRILAGKRIDPVSFNELMVNPPLYIRNKLP